MNFIVVDVGSCAKFGSPNVNVTARYTLVALADERCTNTSIYQMVINSRAKYMDIYNLLPGEIHLVIGPNCELTELVTKFRCAGIAVYNITNSDCFHRTLGILTENE